MEARRTYNQLFSTDNFEFKEIDHENLMQKRIINVLLICSSYDAFMLEEDGRINEKIFLEYTSKNLRYPPQFTKANSAEEAFKVLESKKIDLVVTMLNIGEVDAFEMGRRMKVKHPNIPVVVLTHFSREVSLKLSNEDLSGIDYVFSWLGNTSLMLAIIKLLEDRMNAHDDIEVSGIQAILLVEDSIRYYSSYLPTIYKAIIEQTTEMMVEGLNEHRKTMRMRARPKILLAKSYEEASELYQKYKNNLLGVISDISYSRGGIRDKRAGIKLAEFIRKNDPDIPILLQSSDDWSPQEISYLKASFINKYSKNLLFELKTYIKENYGFGDFVFKDPQNNQELDRAHNLNSLQEKLSTISGNSLEYHVSNNHFSKWLKARALFALANLFADKSRDDFGQIDEVRSYLIDTITNYRKMKGRGVIASRFDDYAVFTRLGDGQLGGKGRGLAFVDVLLKKYKLRNKWEGVTVAIPRTVVLTTDLFDEFMETNSLYEFALKDKPDHEILKRFVNAKTPNRLKDYVKDTIDFFGKPLAVRSSSLLEDSHYQPFAGLYSTYMIPNNHPDIKIRDLQLEQAIKSVYASVFYKESKGYIAATQNVIDEEKMAIVIQEITGSEYGNRFYPTFSGVARSVNFYPIAPEKYEDGVANIALGLGKTIVDGAASLRFSPEYPERALQLSTPELALRQSQKNFFCLDLDPNKFTPNVDESYNLFRLKIKDAVGDGSLNKIASTYDYHDKIIRDGVCDSGNVIVTFSNVLRNKTFPLAEIIKTLLRVGKQEMNINVEIEFAVNLSNSPGFNDAIFNFLQIRPIVAEQEKKPTEVTDSDFENCLIGAKMALGNGVIENIKDLIYVKPRLFNPAKTNDIAVVIDNLNRKFVATKSYYVLVGPGRWGSSDPWLGVPVKWAQISAARLIVESGLKDFQIDPSQGTHFFQNLTSFNVGYFTINPFINDGCYDVDFLDSLPAVYEDELVRHVRFEKPLIIKIDGKKNVGIVSKPQVN